MNINRSRKLAWGDPTWKLDLLCCCNPHVTCVMFCLAARSHHHLFMGFDATIFSTLNPFSLSSKKIHHAQVTLKAHRERRQTVIGQNWTLHTGYKVPVFYRPKFLFSAFNLKVKTFYYNYTLR